MSMTWIVNKTITQESLAEKFSTLMQQKTGFQALYLSGGAFTASKGLPDLGMITSEEVAERAKEIIRATNLPMLVDIDTGFGGVLNVARTAAEMKEAKVAAVQIED